MSIAIDDQQRVLSEVSHDLANRFHRSYYLLDLLGDALDPADSNAAQLLEGLRNTFSETESMIRGALSLLRPLELRRLRVRLEDLTMSLRQHVGVREVSVLGDLAAGSSEVEVDPARISEALAFLCHVAVDGSDTGSPVVVELEGGDPVGLRVHRAEGTGQFPSTLQLALTSRIAESHGGALEVDSAGNGSVTLRLPVASRRT